MKKIRELITKIDNAIRPPHVGPEQQSSITALGGTMNSKDAAEFGGAESAKGAVQIGGPQP
jgi:hypothetical protein